MSSLRPQGLCGIPFLDPLYVVDTTVPAYMMSSSLDSAGALYQHPFGDSEGQKRYMHHIHSPMVFKEPKLRRISSAFVVSSEPSASLY